MYYHFLCYFNKLDSFVRYSLFRSYCTSLYGCELWSLSNSSLESLCIAWRKSLRVIWRLPQQSHSYLLPLISQSLPMYDEICRRFLNFARACINHDSPLIRFIALHGIHHAKTYSFLGHNVWLCSQRFKCPVDVLMSCNSNSIVHRYIDNLYDTNMRRVASFLMELTFIREVKLQLHNRPNDSLLLSRNEIDDIVAHIYAYLNTL